MSPDKRRVIETLLAVLRADLAAATEAVRMAIDEATGEQSKAENQYDTRSLEASYLARGQSERVAALRGAVDFLTRLADAPPMVRAGLGALVQLADEEEGVRWVLLVPKEGGRQLALDGVHLSVLTPDSPLGSELLGATADDEIELSTDQHSGAALVYRVCTVC